VVLEVFRSLLGQFDLPAVFLLVLVVAGMAVVLYRLEARLRTVATVLGGVPGFALPLFLLAVGLGWGGGYDLLAEELPGENGSAVDFEQAPEVRDDLFRAANREDGDDAPVTYRLSLSLTGSAMGSHAPHASSTPTASGVRISTRTPARSRGRSSPNTTGPTTGSPVRNTAISLRERSGAPGGGFLPPGRHVSV
jgi:hypothetical protein